MGDSFGSTLAVLLVFAAVICVAIYFFVKHRKLKEDQMTYEQLQSIVYEEIKDVCELALVRENFKSVVSIDVDKKLPFFDVHIPGTSQKFLMDYSGTIVCGFDLSGVKISRDGALSNKVKVYSSAEQNFGHLRRCEFFQRSFARRGTFSVEYQNRRAKRVGCRRRCRTRKTRRSGRFAVARRRQRPKTFTVENRKSKTERKF